MAYHFFISYSTKDERKAREIRALLDSLGANSWMAPDSISPGEAYTLAIPKAIRESAVLLLVFSRSSATLEGRAKNGPFLWAWFCMRWMRVCAFSEESS